MKNLVIVLSLANLLGEDRSFSFNGYTKFTHISRLADYSIIDIPYRMASLDIIHQSKNLSINGNFTLEFQLKDDAHFLESKDPQDFRLDMRELYVTYSGVNYEFRVGKQIHSWGNVDENSPVDNVSAMDYYYIFFVGIERKIGTMSAAFDYYIDDLKINAVFSPIHSTNRIPLGDDDFPITLPIYPTQAQIFPIDALPFEGGVQGTYSFGLGDVSMSYFSGYDRVFNLTGVNVYGHGADLSFPFVDILFGYRKTNVLGVGGVLLNNWFVLRGDLGYFSTSDQNSSIDRQISTNPVYYDSLHFSYPLLEKADYLQSTIQLETELPFNINFVAQYFTHDTLNYSAGSLPLDQDINIPNLTIDPEDMIPANFFTPGMGVPLALLTNRAAIITVDRWFMNEQLKFSITSMLDLGDYIGVSGITGSLTEYKIEYNIAQDLIGLIELTKVMGSDAHPDGENYQFNKMEDFSHMRFEIKYIF